MDSRFQWNDNLKYFGLLRQPPKIEGSDKKLNIAPTNEFESYGIIFVYQKAKKTLDIIRSFFGGKFLLQKNHFL